MDEAYGIIMQLIDWSQAYDRQCPELAVKSFIENGVRKPIIPVLTNYFQDRKMIVKWKSTVSKMKKNCLEVGHRDVHWVSTVIAVYLMIMPPMYH